MFNRKYIDSIGVHFPASYVRLPELVTTIHRFKTKSPHIFHPLQTRCSTMSIGSEACGFVPKDPHPYHSMGLVYLPINLVDFYGKCRVNMPYMDLMGHVSTKISPINLTKEHFPESPASLLWNFSKDQEKSGKRFFLVFPSSLKMPVTRTALIMFKWSGIPTSTFSFYNPFWVKQNRKTCV